MDGGDISFPNSFTSPEPTDLSINRSNWNIRPPAASWIPVPGLFVGLSVGNSILIALYALGLVSGIGWLKLAQGWNSLPKSNSTIFGSFALPFLSH